MYLALEKDGEVLETHQDFSTPDKYNSALLIPELVKIFNKHTLTPDQLDFITLNVGPGSFTGIRAAAVMARTIGQFLDIPVIGIPSLEIYANAVQSDKNKYVILDARRSYCYLGIYSPDNQVIQEPELIPANEVIPSIDKQNAFIITEHSLSVLLDQFEKHYIKDLEPDLALIIIDLAKKIIASTPDYKELYAWYNLKPVYLQTPSITYSKKMQPRC